MPASREKTSSKHGGRGGGGGEGQKRPQQLTERKCHLPLVQALSHLSGADRREVVANMSDDGVDNVCHVLYNVMFNSCETSAKQKNKMRQAISDGLKDYKYITNKRNPTKKRRSRLMRQSGGSLGFLLSSSIPILLQRIYPKTKTTSKKSERKQEKNNHNNKKKNRD